MPATPAAARLLEGHSFVRCTEHDHPPNGGLPELSMENGPSLHSGRTGGGQGVLLLRDGSFTARGTLMDPWIHGDYRH